MDGGVRDGGNEGGRGRVERLSGYSDSREHFLTQPMGFQLLKSRI